MQGHDKASKSKTNIRRWVRGWQVGRCVGVPVEDCITTTGSMPGKGCEAMGLEGRRDCVCVWGAVKEGGDILRSLS